MSKEVVFNKEAREGIKRGIDKVANAVKVTLGPRGRVVVSSRKIGPPLITKDGVSVAREITLEDPLEEIGAKLTRNVASSTVEDVGDGTTTTVILFQELVNKGLQLIDKGADPQSLRKGMEIGVMEVSNAIDKLSIPISSQEDIEHIASISSNDPGLGKIIGDAFAKVGNNGILTIEEGKTFGVEFEITPGMRINSGFISPYLITDTSRMEAVYEDAYILVTDHKISNIHSLLKLFEQLKDEREIVIIADDFSTEVLGILIRNKGKGIFSSLAIKAPHFGSNKSDLLEDIAIFTGATFISKEAGMKLEDVKIENLGKVRKIISTSTTTTLIDGKGDKNEVTKRASLISRVLEDAEFYEKSRLEARVGNLTGGIGVIKVGAPSEVEMREKIDRIEDAILAVKASVEYGIVPGGGVTLVRVKSKINCDLDDSEKIGFDLILDVLDSPMKQILSNAGCLVELTDGFTDNNFGIDVVTGEYRDMIHAGIIDPTKMIKTALINAVSVAIMVLTCEVAIIELEETKIKYVDLKDYNK